MSRSTSIVRGSRNSVSRPQGLFATHSVRALAARATRSGTPGLIGSGPGFATPRLEQQHWDFSSQARSADAALFAASLIKAGVAVPEDWVASRVLPKFLNQTLVRFVGNRAPSIDYAFDLALTLSPTVERYSSHEQELDPHRVFLSFRVASTVSWVNLSPMLELLEKEHTLLPTIFYHSLELSLSRWFRVFDIQEARCKWDMWMDCREQDEAERREECEREGTPYEPEPSEEPKLPACILAEMPRLSQPPMSFARTTKTKKLIGAVESLCLVSHRARCPELDPQEREDLFPDADPPIPLLALAFGEHDAVIEFLNMELEASGQVDIEPWPILKMDGTDPRSIRQAFRLARAALDTLVAASRVLALVPGFEPLRTYNPFGA